VGYEILGVSGGLLLKWIIKEFGRDQLKFVVEGSVKIGYSRNLEGTS